MLSRTKFYLIVNPYMPDLSGLPDCMDYQELLHSGCRGFWTGNMNQLANCGGRFYRLDGCRVDKTRLEGIWEAYND